jgi:TRAP-type mannitol/chloroaromatic compound transport system permease small subunit
LRAALRLADGIDAVSRAIGASVKWLAVVLVMVQFVVVVLRYVYGSSFIWLQESVVYVHAALFMLAIGYAYLLDAHVRVDFFTSKWSERAKAWLEIVGILVTALPFCWLLVWASWGYVERSFRMGEGPMAVGGLPLMPYLKALILVMAGLLAVQSLSIVIRAVGVLLGRERSAFPSRQTMSEG